MKKISLFRAIIPVLNIIGLAILAITPVYISAKEDFTAEPTDSIAQRQKLEGSNQKWEMRNLERFLRLSPEKLAEMRRTIQTIEKMNPEERDALRRRLEEYKNLHQNMRQRLKGTLGDIPPGDLRYLRRHFFLLNPEQRKAEHNKINGMTPEKRRAYYLEVIEQMRRKHSEKRRVPFRSEPIPSTTDESALFKTKFAFQPRNGEAVLVLVTDPIAGQRCGFGQLPRVK